MGAWGWNKRFRSCIRGQTRRNLLALGRGIDVNADGEEGTFSSVDEVLACLRHWYGMNSGYLLPAESRAQVGHHIQESQIDEEEP